MGIYAWIISKNSVQNSRRTPCHHSALLFWKCTWDTPSTSNFAQLLASWRRRTWDMDAVSVPGKKQGNTWNGITMSLELGGQTYWVMLDVPMSFESTRNMAMSALKGDKTVTYKPALLRNSTDSYQTYSEHSEEKQKRNGYINRSQYL